MGNCGDLKVVKARNDSAKSFSFRGKAMGHNSLTLKTELTSDLCLRWGVRRDQSLIAEKRQKTDTRNS